MGLIDLSMSDLAILALAEIGYSGNLTRMSDIEIPPGTDGMAVE